MDRSGRDPMLQAILNSTYNGIITIDRSGKVVVMNQAAERLAGVPASQACGRHILDVIPTSGLVRVLETGASESGQQMIIGGRSMLTNRSPIWRDGEIVGAVGCFQDLSDIEQIFSDLDSTRRLVQQLDAVIESSSDGIYITDGKGITLRCNRAYEEITGISAAEVVGRSMSELEAEGYISQSVTLLVLEHRRPMTIMQTVRQSKEVIVTGNPVVDRDGNIVMVVTSVRDISRLNALQRELQEERARSGRFQQHLADLWLPGGEPVGRSKSMNAVLNLAAQVAPFPTTVLIQGETGVGKELIAAYIRRRSPRTTGPFVKVNCGAIPGELLEAELFGYEPGSFTGAKKDGKPGLFELADKGTILLDEIDSLPVSLQVKLLRVLQEQEVLRVGAIRPRKVDVRIIAITNKDLDQLVAQGKFREDLFYRLNVVRILVPPLRERPEDIPALAEHILAHFCSGYGLAKSLGQGVLECMVRYDWPGNVRQLRNLIENLVVSLPSGVIEVQHLPQRMMAEQDSADAPVAVHGLVPLREGVAEVERQLLRRALGEAGSLRAAARDLRVDHATLLRKMRRYGLTAGRERPAEKGTAP